MINLNICSEGNQVGIFVLINLHHLILFLFIFFSLQIFQKDIISHTMIDEMDFEEWLSPQFIVYHEIIWPDD